MRSVRSLLLVSALTLVCVGGVPARVAHAGSCQGIAAAVAAVDAQIADLEAHDVGPYGHPGEPLKPQKNLPLTSAQKAELKALQIKLGTLQAQLAACEAPPPTPALTVSAITASGIGAPDPQIAVGHKYVAAIDTGTIVFYDKATMQKVAPGAGFALASNPISASALFKSFFTVMDAQMKLPSNVCDATKPGWDASFDPANPNKAIPGCIKEAYDTRVVYDAPRHRFWIASAVRNPLWQCAAGGVNIGGYKKSDGTLLDPDPSNPTNVKCHADWKTSWAHRFIALAVSQVGANGQEDLSKPFHQFALVDDYADWPLLGVHGKFLILTHRDAGKALSVFDADALANGVKDKTSMQVKPLATFPSGAFGAGSTAPASPVYLANVHGTAADPFYLVSSNGNALLVSAIAVGPSGKPKVVPGALVMLATPLGLLRHNPVYRSGKLYLTDFACDTPCTHYDARVMRVPAGLNKTKTAIVATGSGLPGFLSYRMTAPKTKLSYEVPSVEANANGDMIVAFQVGRLPPSTFIPFAVRYSAFYHDKTSISSSALLHGGVWTNGSPLPGDPGGGGTIDLSGIAVDPSDDRTIWMSHAYSNGTGYTQIMGAVKP
ncbi:MAG: hypothetical protein JWN27_3599 [Candidatus Eremiobacteraeota bacterium]|nr:hypothetical protein [Candidatus Eremiobacteraeota bacterium]